MKFCILFFIFLISTIGFAQKNNPTISVSAFKGLNKVNDTTQTNIVNCVVTVHSPSNNNSGNSSTQTQVNVTLNLKNSSETDSLIIKVGRRPGMFNIKSFKIKYQNSNGVKSFNDNVSTYQIINGTSLLTLALVDINFTPNAYLTIGTKRKNGTSTNEFVTVIQKNGK